LTDFKADVGALLWATTVLCGTGTVPALTKGKAPGRMKMLGCKCDVGATGVVLASVTAKR